MEPRSNGFKERLKTSKGRAVRSGERISAKPKCKEKQREDRYTSSLSIFQKQKSGKPAAAPKADIAESNRQPCSSKHSDKALRPRSPKTPELLSEERRGKERESHRRFVSLLKTSLSTEWKSGSRGSSSEGDSETPSAENTGLTQLTPACSKEKLAPVSELEYGYESVRLTVPRISGRSAREDTGKTETVSVRVQRARKHHSISDKSLVGGTQKQLNIRRFNVNSNLSKRLPRIDELSYPEPKVTSKKRALPKSYFRVKSQKASGHHSVTVTNPGNSGTNNSCEPRNSVVVQRQQKLRPFTIYTIKPRGKNQGNEGMNSNK